MGSTEKYDLENGEIAKSISVVKTRESLLRTRSETDVLSSVRFRLFRIFFENVRQVIFGTKLFVLFPAIPMAFVAQRYSYGRPWIFALSLIGLTPLAERLSFLTEQIAYFTGPTGSIISNLLLVLGSSLLCGGIANLNKEQNFDHKQADVNSLVLLLGLLCQTMPLLFNFRSMEASKSDGNSVLQLSRATSILMLLAYVAYLFFQLKTHSQFFGSQQDEGEVDEVLDKETAAIGFWSAFIWLCLMTIIISVLSEYVVGTIEDASETWGISVNFISIIVLPIVGNAAEHAGSIIFAFKNKLDISLGVCMGSASQILMFVVPLCVIVAWIMGIPMNLDFGFLETGCLAFSILLTAFSLQDGSSHYLKGVVLALAYIAIGACFFVQRLPFDDGRNGNKLGSQNESSFVV
ncbi:vacuolar cation/proton exchanger 1-like isoform X3 [Cynara cardunculus var. scolymus]|uniref:vacuolar cation/proton exchanger 1-like isoform X3 n=1 Tax=Cynara cardunculus var. scolymus TaxID=59895 RepID=UPI000D625723|nr:vacuolar cation/proton exchanger 1-like isoform X3 [Cynara cardunculus var. scolymus]